MCVGILNVGIFLPSSVLTVVTGNELFLETILFSIAFHIGLAR